MERVRHQPEETVLYRVVREHLGDFLRAAREEHGELPRFIEKTFRSFLACGLPERGFIRLKCDACAHEEVLAFSCKRRGVCPSCAARAMADGAAHLVEHVLPRAPMRQWVVSYPFALGSALAFQPELLRAVERLVASTLTRWQERRCGGGKSGGVLVRHRFGSSLNLHVHAHLLLLDGAFVGEPPVFARAPPPTPDELRELAREVDRRLHRLLAGRGLLSSTPAEERTNELPGLDALGACAQVALQQGHRERAGAALRLPVRRRSTLPCPASWS